VSFLLEKSNNRIKPLKILEEFDKMKNKFEPDLKSKIKCSNLTLNSDYNFEMNCSAFS
jgi:hypothetical protein